MVAGRFPSLSARFTPATRVTRARIAFHAEGDLRWYSVDMTPDGPSYRGILPQPLAETRAVHYFIEALDRHRAASRTAEATSVVVGSAGEC